MAIQECQRMFSSASAVPESLRHTHRIVKLHSREQRDIKERKPLLKRVVSRALFKDIGGFHGVVLYPGREQPLIAEGPEGV